MALPGPVRASKFGGSGSNVKRVYRNIALDFQSFQELWVGLKRGYGNISSTSRAQLVFQ